MIDFSEEIVPIDDDELPPTFTITAEESLTPRQETEEAEEANTQPESQATPRDREEPIYVKHQQYLREEVFPTLVPVIEQFVRHVQKCMEEGSDLPDEPLGWLAHYIRTGEPPKPKRRIRYKPSLPLREVRTSYTTTSVSFSFSHVFVLLLY